MARPRSRWPTRLEPSSPSTCPSCGNSPFRTPPNRRARPDPDRSPPRCSRRALAQVRHLLGQGPRGTSQYTGPTMTRVVPRQRLADRYVVETHVADGGMASVWRARDEVLARTVAVKTLREEFAGRPDFRERFRREA